MISILYFLFIDNDYEFLNIVKENNYLKNKNVHINDKEVKVLDINNTLFVRKCQFFYQKHHIRHLTMDM